MMIGGKMFWIFIMRRGGWRMRGRGLLRLDRVPLQGSLLNRLLLFKSRVLRRLLDLDLFAPPTWKVDLRKGGIVRSGNGGVFYF